MSKMENDIHNTKSSFERIENLIGAMPDDSNGVLLKKYLQYHKERLGSGTISYGGATRSLEIAFDVCDSVDKVSLMKVKPLENYWNDLIQRKIKRRLPSGKVIELESTLKEGSIQKYKSQIQKFYKFVKFLEYNKPLSLFNSKGLAKPECCDFLFYNKSKKRKDFPSCSQEKVRDLINDLTNSKEYYSRMAGVFVALANDFGGRFSEIANLRMKDVVPEQDYYVIHITHSKTAERKIICVLAKSLLKNWVASVPNGENDLIFPSFKGEKISYNCLRLYLKRAAKKVGIDLPNGKAFHFFRHLCSSRLYEMPSTLKNYWMGWELIGMEAVYSHPDYKQCKKYYFKSLNDNPMLDMSLSLLEKEERVANDSLQDRIKAMEKIFEAMSNGVKPEDFIEAKLKEAGNT